jgi:hypothetical protein
MRPADKIRSINLIYNKNKKIPGYTSSPEIYHKKARLYTLNSINEPLGLVLCETKVYLM